MRDWDRRAEWLERAESLKPELEHWAVEPRALVEPEFCEDAWQKCRMRDLAPAAALRERAFGGGDSFTVDSAKAWSGGCGSACVRSAGTIRRCGCG